jgi:hypothetical protein
VFSISGIYTPFTITVHMYKDTEMLYVVKSPNIKLKEREDIFLIYVDILLYSLQTNEQLIVM